MANIKDTVGSLFDTASKGLSDVKESVSEVASYAGDKIGDIVDYALETPKSPQADQFKAGFQDFGKRIEESKNAPTISDSIVDLYNQGKQNLSDNYNQLKEDLIPARDAIGRTIDNVIKEQISTPEKRKNSLLGKIISGDSAFKETGAKFRKGDEELADDYAKINSEESSKGLVGAGYEAFKGLLSGSDLEKALPTTMSESDFFRRAGRFGQEINEESNRLATLQAESRFSAFTNFTNKLENEFRTVKGISVTDEIDQDQLNEYFSMKLDTLPRSEAKTIINQYKSFNSEAKKIYDAINLKQDNMKAFLNETLKFPGKTGEEVYNEFNDKVNANESTNKYIKVLQKQFNLAKSDVDKQLDFYAPVLAKADNFKQWSELVDSMYETSAQQKSYIANARNLPVSKGLQDEIISKGYDSYDASLRYMGEYAKLWADPEMRKQYPDTKYSTLEFKKIVMHEVEKNISDADKKAIEDMDKLMARVEIERNRNSVSNTKLDLSNKKFNIPFADTDLIYDDSRTGNAASTVANIGTYLGKQGYNIYGVAGGIGATAGLAMRDEAGYRAENIGENTFYQGGSAEFRDIARKYREQNGEAYLDRTIRSEFNGLLRSGEDAYTASKELVAGNSTEIIPMIMSLGLVNLGTKVIRVGADIGTKTIGTGINKAINSTIANPKVLKQVTNIGEKLQAGQAAKLAQSTGNAIKAKTNDITTSISTRLGFDDIQIPTILQTSVNRIGRFVDYSIKSIGSSAVTDPTFNVIAGDAPTDMIQGMNATIGLLFDAGISTGISTVKGGYRFGKSLTGYATGKEISAPTPETTIFQETGRFLNDSMNNIMYGFVTGNQMKAVKQVQDAYIKNGINLSGQTAKALLDAGAAMYKSIYDPKQVSDLFNNKGELATFLAKNISEMDKKNMTELLTGKGIGIKLHKFAGLEEGDFNNLLSLVNATKNLKDPGQQKAARLQINAYLNKVEDFVTGKGGVDRISIAKEFSDNKDIMAKNKAGFDKRKANLLSATTPEEISDAMDELNGFIYKIQATQGSERHKQIVTLTDGNPDNKITLTFEEIAQLGDKNIDDLINEGRITIGKNEFGRKEGVYTVVDTRFEQTVTDIINGNQEIKQLINKFKENIDSGEYAVKIGSKELDRAIIGFFTGNKSKIEWTGIDPKLSIEYANLVRDIASKIFIDADIPQVVVIPNAEKGTAKMSSGENIINMLGEVEGDIVISTGSYVRKEGDDTINAIYITLGKNFTENPVMKPIFDIIDDKAGGVLNIYMSEVKKLMEDIFELSQDGKGLSLDKGRTLYTNLYDALGNPTKDENKILEDIYSITQDIESTHFIMDVLKKSNASNQSHAGLLAINLAYAYRLNKTLIDELIARGKKAGDNMDNIHSVFSKILLGNVQDVYARVFGKEYNFDIPTTEIADAYHRARLEYINGYENQKFLLKQENEKLTVDYNANKDTDVRKALKKLMKENDKRIKNIDKILSKVNTFKESFIKDLATKQAFGYIKSLADMVSYNFLFREADDIIGTTFMKATPPLLKRGIAGLLPPGGSVPDFVPPVEETKLIEGASQKLLGTSEQKLIEGASEQKLIEGASQKLLGTSEQKLLATTGNIAGVEKAMTYQDALRDLFMDSYNKLKELPPINQAQVLELLANYSKNKTTQLREAFYRETMEKFNRDILGTKGKNSILIKKKELFKNLANEFLFSNPRLDLLDNISLDVLSGVTPVYSQAYLKDNPLVLTSLTSAINGSTAGDESIKQAFLKTLGVPEGIDFIQYINSSEGAELKNRINDLYADNMNVYQKIDQRLKWIKGVIHSTMKDITIDTFDGNKKVNVTSDLLRKFFNSNQFADLIKTLKASNEKVKVENVYDANGKLVTDYITIPLKLKRMEASGMDMKYTIGVDNIKVIQFFKDGVDIGSSSITKGLKAFRKKMIDDGYRFMGSFGDKDSYLQWYKPVDSKFDVETTYLQEYALSEKYIIGEPKSKKEILEALASGDDEGLNIVFKLTTITKREASQMSERNTFEKVDMPVMTYVFDETVNDKDLIPSITIYPDGTWESDITLSPSEFGHIQNHIDNAYIDGSLNIDKANDDINHYLENVFSKEDSKGNRKSYQDGFSVMSDKLMTLRNKISAYFKETDEVKDHVFGEHNGHAFMFKTQFNRGVIKFDGVEIEHGVAIGDGSFKMGGESYKDIKNMEPYPDGENHYIMIDDVPHRLKYPPFEISTQDFKSASSDSVKKQEQASIGSAIFARLPAEYAEEIGEIQEQDITKLWNKTVGNLLDLNVNVSGYSRILKYMQALQEYTGIGDKHSSIISAKVDEFVNEVNALLTKTKVDAGGAYIRQVDRNISDQEILLSKNHPVVRKAQEKTDSYVELENIKREELGQEALTQAEIASYRESQLVTTMYRFPVPSMYNIGVYKILVLEDELAKGNTKFKKYSKMGEKQMVLSPMVAYLKLEADFDGDKVFFAPLNTEYGQVIAKSILGVPASFDRADIGKYAVDAINNNEFRNKYVRTAQIEDIKVQKVERFKGRWKRADVKLQDDKVFLFGDNTDDRLNTHHIPSSTQAVIRGLPNAIGIDTKKNMGTNEAAVILPTIKSNPVNIDAKFPKDQTKANYSDGIIAYGTHSTGKYAERFGGTRTTFNVGETIMISVNGNNRANQAENVEKTKRAIDKAINSGVVAFIADNENVANSLHNSGGEGEIRNYLLAKGLKYKLFKGVGLYVVNRANVPDATIDRHAESYKQMLEDIKSEGINNYDVNQSTEIKPNFDVLLPIGTSGSGKSTFIKSLPQKNLVVIEPDAMRVEFTGNINDKSKDKEIYIEAANRAIQAIKQGKQVVFDTTNLTKDKRLPFIESIKKEIPTANIQYKLMELNPELAKQRIKDDIERINNFEPALKENPVNINAKFPKDQVKANYADGIIGYGTHSTGKYVSAFGGTRTSFNKGETIMISVNGNNRTNQAENVEKTKKAIDLALEKGVINFVADNSTIANSSHNSGGEGVIREYLISKGLQYREFNGVGLYSVTQSSYFTDADFPQFKQQVDEAIQKAKDSGKTIVISNSGIGTDKAQLEKRAPKLFKYLQSELNKLEKSSTKGDNKSIVQDRITKLIAKKGIAEVSATYRSLSLLQQEVTMRLRKDPNFFDKLKQDSEWNLLKTFSMNREGIDSEMASGLQIVLDFGKSGLTEFDTQFLNDIIHKAFGVTDNNPYGLGIDELVQSLSTSFGNNFPVSKFDFKAPRKDKFGEEIEEGPKPITKSGVIFDTMNSIFKQYSSYLSILGSNNEKIILSTTLLRNKLTSLRSLYSDFVTGDRFTMAGIKNNIFNGRDTPYVTYINRVNKELTDMINSGSIDGIVLSEAKKKMLLSLIDNFQKEFDKFISSIRSTNNTRVLKDIKLNFYLSDHVDIARFSEEEKLVLAFMSSVYGERYLKDYYSAGDLTRYILDTQEAGENNIRSVLKRMASDGYEVDNLDSNAVLALFQRDTITKSDVKDLIENTKVKMDNLNQLKSELIETEAPSKELTESLETLNSAIKNTEKELENLEVQSEIVSIRDKGLSKDDQESLGVYNQYVNYLLETPQAYNDLKQALAISRIRYNTLTNQEKQNSQLGLYSIASDINPDYLMDYLKTRFKNLDNDLETNKKTFVENVKNKLTELNLNAHNDLNQALDISRIRYNRLANQEKQNSQLGLYSLASDINPDYLMDYLKTRFKNLDNDLETNKKSFVENVKNKLTELNLNVDPYKFESDVQLMMKDIEDSNQLMQDQVIYDGVLELYNLRESIRGLTLPKYIEAMTKYVNQFKDSIKKQTDIELNNLLFKVTKDIDDGYEDGSIRNIINDEVETLTNEVNAKLNKLVKDIFVPTDIVPYRALALYDNNKQLVPTNIGEYTYDEKTALSMNSIYDSDITNEFGDVSVVTPAYTPKMDYGSMLISVHDEGLMDDMIKEMDKLDRLQQDGLVFTLKKATQKWLPDFYNLYEGIRNIVNYENKIPAASDYNVREFTWIPFVKNIYSILKGKKLSGSEIRSLMLEFQSMLLANNMGVYRAYDEDVITRALESMESKNELLLGISKDEAFRKRVTDYVTNVINPVADMLNEIQERVMKPNGDTIGKHYGITDKDSKASEYKNKLVQDLLESHKGDPQFARVLSSIYDKADLQKLLIDRQTERGEKIFYGTENNLNELMFGIDLGVLSKGLNAILGLTQSFNYSMKYGAVSLVTGSGMIAGISQLIPNIVELIAYKRAYSKDIDKGYDVMLKYNILDSENVIRNGTGHGKNIDPNIIGEAIGRVAAGVGYIPVKTGIGMYNVLANSIKISNSSVAQAIDGGKYAKAAGDLTNSFLTNPLGFFDFPLENMRKAVAVTTVMNNLGIKSLKEFDDIVERFGDKFLNKFNALVSGEFANTGGGVVSGSSIQRRNVFDSAYNMVPAAIRPAAYFINKAAGFLMGWAFHKTAVGLEMTGNVMWSFKRFYDGDFKQSFAHFEAASRYTYMLAQQAMILLGLYMQMEKREKDPEDMQNWDNFLKAYTNIGVIYDMVFGKYVDMKMDINEIDPNASIGNQAGMFAYMQAEQIFRTFNQGEYARMVHDYYVKKNAAAGPNGEGVTIIDALLWALDQKYATSMRIINADLADRHYDTLNTANTAMLLTEGQSITDEVTDLFNKKKYDKFKSQGLWMSLLGMGSKLLGFTESEAVTASIAEDIRKQILGEDKEISKLYNGGQISEIPGDYQLSTIIGKTKNPITDDEKESVDNIWSKIGYYKYNAVNRQGKRIIANDASESKSQQIIEKEFERIQKEKGVDMEKLLSASPNSPEFEVALAMVATESNIATPTIIAYKLEKEYNNERTRLQKLVGKKEITGYKGLDAYQESEIKRNILTKNQVLLNLATPFAEIIVGEHMDKYHSDIFDRLTPKDGANETSKGAPDKNEYIKGEVINLINTHQLIAKNVAEGDTNVDRLTSKFALATKGISNTEVGANIIIGMLHDIERLPIDKKAKLANQAALIMGLNKSQYQFMKDNAEFEKLTEDSQRQLTNWMYKINTEVNDFDSNNLSFKANEAGSNYSKYPKTFKKTPYRIPGEYSKSGIGGQRPNFSKQFGGLQNMMSGKEDLVVPRYDKYLSNKEEEYARSLPPAPSYGSHYKQTFYRYTIQNTFYGYDSKGTLNPFINPSTVKGPVKRFIKLKKKFKKKK